MLKNLSIRIKQYENGYAIEFKQKRFIGFRWVNIVYYNGCDDVYYYNTYQSAVDDLMKMIKWQLQK